jgi:hypothetical protein
MCAGSLSSSFTRGTIKVKEEKYVFSWKIFLLLLTLRNFDNLGFLDRRKNWISVGSDFFLLPWLDNPFSILSWTLCITSQ